MRLLAVSDLHLDAAAAEALVSAASAADLILAAGDFANGHDGLYDYMRRLDPIAGHMICVPGNNETLDALRNATDATVLHGQSIERHGLTIAGIGGGIPPIPPQPWQSWDFSEEDARTLLDPIPAADILVSHSPPAGLGDNHSALGHIGSTAVKDAMLRLSPRLCVFGHVHDCWGEGGRMGRTEWRNLGPAPVRFDL